MLSAVALVFCGVLSLSGVQGGSEDSPSHLKPFGWGKSIQMEEVDGFVPVKTFFEEYVIPNKPVVMRGANKIWPGYENWQTDKYFMNVAPEKPYIISMDVKRGNPDKPSDYVDFKEFVQMYNTSQRRMVEFTPEFLKKDVLVPACVDCQEITQGEILMGNKIWFGAQYTTSVVHKDAADNINCLVYGVKNYTVLSPKYDPNVVIDRPDGLYSTMDVDSVDADKYPGLDGVEYQLTELQGGDCIFIPYKWIHQVRSYGRNIAVNIWWNHWKNKELDLSKCAKQEEGKSISDALFHGWGDFENRDEGVLEHTKDLLSMAHILKPVTFPRWVGIFTNGLKMADHNPMQVLRNVDPDLKRALKEAFKTMNADKDSKITPEEFKQLTEEQKQTVIKAVKYVLKTTRQRANSSEANSKDLKERNRKKVQADAENAANQKTDQGQGQGQDHSAADSTADTDSIKHDEF